MKVWRTFRAWLTVMLLPPPRVVVAPAAVTIASASERLAQEHVAACPCLACLLKREQALQADIAAWNAVATRIPSIRWQPTQFPMRLQ